MGRTKTSKLLAPKRPSLIPIFDSVVERLLPPVVDHWEAFGHVFADDDLPLLLAIASRSGAPEGATLLRKLDVLLWMIGQQPDW